MIFFQKVYARRYLEEALSLLERFSALQHGFNYNFIIIIFLPIGAPLDLDLSVYSTNAGRDRISEGLVPAPSLIIYFVFFS